MSIYYDNYKKELDQLASDEHSERVELAYRHAKAFIIDTNQVSISKIQRALRIGYNQAARIVERMESEGLVSKPERNGSRTVLLACFANKGDSEENMFADMAVDHAMKLIDAENEDHANIRSVVERMLAAGYTKTETCDPLGYE